MDLIIIIFLLGSAQGIFIAVVLFNKPGNKTANKLLAFLLISYSAFIAESALSGTEIASHFPHLLGLAAGVVFLIPPLHYFYARCLISSSFVFSKKDLLHLLPFLAFYAYNLFPYYLQSGAYKIEYIQNFDIAGKPPVLVFFNWLVLAQGVTYMLFTLKLLKKHALNIKDIFSSIQKVSLNWLRNITLMTLALWIVGIIAEIIQTFDPATTTDLSVPVLVSIFIYTMGYMGLRQPEIFSEREEPKDSIKYKRSGLSEDKAITLKNNLTHLMNSEKPFIDSQLRLSELAKMLSTSPNHLSQVINDHMQQNFFDFINYYRIEEAKQLLMDTASAQFTLLAIANDVGFNSKSAFNSAFKKHTLITPSQFRDNSLN